MAKQVATPKQEGGGGCSFEDKVTASFLLKLLSGDSPLESRAGSIQSMGFQKRVDGWHLDDLVLTLRDLHGNLTNFALSVKSSSYISKSGFPEEFTKAVWEQTLHVGGGRFDLTRDYLGIATAPLDLEVSTAWNGLLGKALVASPEEFATRIGTARYCNQIERDLFESLKCPADLGTPTIETVTLLQRIRHLPFDFESYPSECEKSAVSTCQRLLRSGDLLQAISMWEHLKQISRNYASNGGDIGSKAELASLLRGHFDLAEFPDYVPDWAKVSVDTAIRLDKVRNRLGGVLNLERKEAESISLDHGIAALVGASGSGKSAIASQITKRFASSGHAVWLSASMLNRHQLNTLFTELNLVHSFAELLSQSTIFQGVIVVDGAEHLTEEGLAHLGGLIECAGIGTPGTPWRMAITCVFDQWENVLLRLKRQCTKPIDVELHPIEFRHHLHLQAIVDSFPQLQLMLLRPQLGRLFDNLKILDLVVSHASNLTLSETWVGETDILDWYWKEVVNRGANGQGRSRFLMKLACVEADRFLSEVPSMDFESSECEFVSALIADDVISVQHDRFGFTHDLLGDWARSRYLLSNREAVVELIREKVLLPRWQKAIRLYGLRLLESHDCGVDQWARLIADLQPDDAMAVELDLILESVVFAANADQILSDVWTALIANDALLLNRLLTRFLHTATLPNPRMVTQLNEVSTAAATFHRLPYWPLWGPILRLLHERQQEAIALAPLQIARIASMWLRMTPCSSPLRAETAKVMISTTELVIQQSRARYGDELGKEAYAGLLAAAPEFPDTVASRALELVERGKDSPFAHRNRADADSIAIPEIRDSDDSSKSRQRRDRLFEVGPMREPWPNGPRRRVEPGVREGFLAHHNPLQNLFRVRPNAAKEVLLALLINWPTPMMPSGLPFSYGVMDSLEINSDREFRPPMYYRGPFLAFLFADAEKGIDVIVTLVEFATARWRERNPNVSAVECNVEGVKRSYFGGMDLFYRYRGNGHRYQIHAIESALMALEKWLNDCVDSRRDISSFVAQLLRQSQSTAVLGVLVAVGVQHPELFRGPLRFVVLVWQLQVLEEDYYRSGFGSFGHQKAKLGSVLLSLYLQDREIRAELNRQREIWSSQLLEMSDPDERMRLANLVRRFDERNWRTRPVDNGVVIEYAEPEEVIQEQAPRREVLQLREDISFLPLACRKMLDENEGIPSEDLESFWERLQRIGNAANSDSEHTENWQNAVMGGIAVLWTHHREWVEINADRKAWGESMFAQVLSAPPPWPRYDTPESFSNYHWDNFVATLLPGILSEDPKSDGCRRLVADFAAAYRYTVVADVVASASRCRGQLGDDFPRLLHLVFAYSGYCNIHVTTQGGNNFWNTPDVGYDIGDSVAKLIDGFVSRSLRPEVPSLSEIAVTSNAMIADMNREQDKIRCDVPWTDQVFVGIQERIHRGWGFEPGLIQTVFGWIDQIDRENDPIERNSWIALIRNILDAFLRPLRGTAQAVEDREHNFPCDRTIWLFDRIALVIPQLRPHENARNLWEPILSLGLDRFCWVDTFLSCWFIQGCSVEGGDVAFFREWETMISFAWDQQGWRDSEVQHHRSREELFRSLMGLDFTGEYYLADSKYRSFVSAMKPEYDRWADEFLDAMESAKCYARFLTSPSAVSHIRDGVRRLSERVKSYGDWCWREDRHLHTALLDLLEYDWRTNRAVIKRDTAVRKEFSTILKAMLDRQIPRAMELQDQIVRGG